MSPIAAPADRRFHRAHVKPARRRSWLALVGPATKYALLAAAITYAAFRTGMVVAQSGVLHVQRIAVRGNARLSTGEVLAVLTGLQGQNLLSANLDEWRERLLASPWVRNATMRRALPSTVEVVVAEREPVAIARIKDTLYLIDEQGVVIDEYGPQYADFDLPIVDGLAAGSQAGPVRADEERAALASRVIAALKGNPDVMGRLSQIDVSNLHNASVILTGDPAVLYVGDDRFLPRLETYLEISTALAARVPDIDYIDLRFDDRIYVRPAGKPPRAGTSLVKR